MKTTIIFTHPWHGSFNKAILDKTIAQLQAKNQEFNLIDLNKDAFNPTLSEQDLALFGKGESSDPLVKKYQTYLSESDKLIFISPIWWLSFPAIAKGFIDKILLPGFAYKKENNKMVGILTHIKHAQVLTTSEVPTFMLKLLGNHIGIVFCYATLKWGAGIKKTSWHNCGNVSQEKSRLHFLKKLDKLI